MRMHMTSRSLSLMTPASRRGVDDRRAEASFQSAYRSIRTPLPHATTNPLTHASVARGGGYFVNVL